MLRCVLSILNYAWIFLSFLDLYIGTSHPIEEHFSHYSFKNVLTLFSFPPPLHLPATSENPVIPVLDHAITPTDDWGSIYGFSIFFSLFFNLGMFYWSYSSSLILFSAVSNLLFCSCNKLYFMCYTYQFFFYSFHLLSESLYLYTHYNCFFKSLNILMIYGWSLDLWLPTFDSS